MKSLTVFLELESYFHKFQFSYWFQSFSVKCGSTVTLKNIGGFGLSFWNLTPPIQNPGSATVYHYIYTNEEKIVYYVNAKLYQPDSFDSFPVPLTVCLCRPMSFLASQYLPCTFYIPVPASQYPLVPHRRYPTLNTTAPHCLLPSLTASFCHPFFCSSFPVSILSVHPTSHLWRRPFLIILIHWYSTSSFPAFSFLHQSSPSLPLPPFILFLPPSISSSFLLFSSLLHHYSV